MDVALDGIHSYEEPSTIQERIRDLPPELDSLFAHIMHHRIPQHFRQEAFRYLLIAYQWQKVCAGGPLSAIIVITAQRASSYLQACQLVCSGDAEVNAAELFFPSRLAHRCHGLLECVDSRWFRQQKKPMPAVNFLHRTLFDYLAKGEGVRHVLDSEAGDEFDVNTAIMAGLINVAKAWRYIHKEDGNMLRYYYQYNFLEFNLLAENFTGLSRSKLIAAYDRVEASQVKKLTTDSGTETQPNLKTLRETIEKGSILYLEEVLQKRLVSGVNNLSSLLGILLMAYLSGVHGNKLPRRGTFLETFLKTVALLLAHGADPMSDISFDRGYPRGCFEFILDSLKMSYDVDHTERWLHVLLLFYQLRPDSSERFIESEQERTTVDLGRLLGDSDCCDSSVPVELCACHRARAWRPLAWETIRLHEQYKREMNTAKASEPKEAQTKLTRGIVATDM